MKFICVMNEKVKNTLLNQGYKLINADVVNSIWTFENSNNVKFDLNDISHILSDTLRF